MERNLNNKISEINKVQFANRWWYKFVVCLSAFAVFFVTYFLMLPAMTDSVTTYGTEVITTEGMDSNNIYPIDAILGPEAGYKNLATNSTPEPGIYNGKTGIIVNSSNVNTILIKLNTNQNLRSFFYGNGNAGSDVTSPFGIDLGEWIGMKFSYSEQYGRYYLAHVKTKVSFVKTMTTGDVSTDKGFILLVRKSFVNGNNMYIPDSLDGNKDGSFQCVLVNNSETYTYKAENDIYAHVNTTPLDKYDGKYESGEVVNFLAISGCRPSMGDVDDNKYPGFGFITISPYIDQNNVANAKSLDNDIVDKRADHITFKLFDYSENINKASTAVYINQTGTLDWAYLSPAATYFSFRNDNFQDAEFFKYWGKYAVCTCGGTSYQTCKRPIKSHIHRNESYDADGFTINHATTHFTLHGDGFPLFDIFHNAKGEEVTTAPKTENTYPVTIDRWRLGYLFSGKIAEEYVEAGEIAPGAVTAYDPTNTILQYDSKTSTYWYDSALNAVDYDTVNNKFYLRGYTEKNDDSAAFNVDMTDYSDFLPFNYGKGIVTETYSVYNEDFESTHRASSFNRYDPLSKYYTNVNYWFGMTMEFTFIQSKDGTVITYDEDGNIISQEDMIFTFSGDDDVWVFVDEVKVLELGGTHGEVTGYINFKTGEIKQYMTWEGRTEADTATSFPTTLRACFERAGRVDSVKWEETNKTFEDYTVHTLKFFYLERGAAVANCSIKFNLPSFSDKALIVEKNLQHDSDDTDELSDEVLEYLRDTKDFEFRVLQANNTLLFVEGDKFQIFNKETGKTTDATVGPDGIFTLKHNEQAIFGNLWEKTGSTETEGGIISYYVQELIPNSQTGQYDSVMYSYDINANKTTVTGADCGVTGFKGYTSPELKPTETHTVVFTNTVSVDDLYELTIEKTLETIPGAPSLSSEDFNVKVTLDGTLLPVGTVYQVTGETTTRTVTEEGIVTITPGEKVVIKGILAGTTYVVEEQFDLLENGYIIKYDGVISSEGTTGSISGDKTIEITNSQSGANISIPILKTLQNALSTSNYSFNFSLIEVKKNDSGGFTGNTVLDTLSLTLDGVSSASGEFNLQYLAADFNTGDTKLYYKIVETTDSGDRVSLIDYDTAAYIVTVNIKKATTGVLDATIEGITKYSNVNITSEGTSEESVAFVNTLNLYTLPATGGDGQTYEASLFKVGGILIICAIAGLMLCISACKRRQINM